MFDISVLAVLTIFPVCMLLASFYDLFTMTIPNKVTLFLGVAFFVLAPLTGIPLATMAWHIGLGFAVLIVCYGLFMIRAMGGGDAKLLAASALWLGPELVLPYVLFASVLGGFLTILIIAARAFALPSFMLKVDWIGRLHDKRTGIPYGLALGPAALLVFPDSIWMKLSASSGLT